MALKDRVSTTELGTALPIQPSLHVYLKIEELNILAVTPWFSFRCCVPARPLPDLSERKHMTTKRLLIRPIQLEDLDQFHELRKIPETQEHSKIRGRPDRSREETRQAIENLVSNYEDHWYWGIFLLSTGEMIGEGGLPNCVTMSTSNSGWPESEFLLQPQYWRQGYGTEMFGAIIDSWKELPRAWRRLQIVPLLAQGYDPGDAIPESLVFQWESRNERATKFFSKMLAQEPAAADGAFETLDTREGSSRFGELVKWNGTLAMIPGPSLEDSPEP